jgi:glycosyltransferase involved in cell wall biosynthesis
MISVVIATQNHQRELGPVLAALVPAAVEGLVRQVIVVDGGSTDATLEIAEDAGADIVRLPGARAARLAAGCAGAKGDWLLILDPAIVPPPGWIAAARAHLADHPDLAAWFAPGASGLFGRAPAVHGLLIERRLLERLGGYGTGLTRRLGRQLKRLRPARNTL